MSDPLMSHLLDILSESRPEDLILAGGFGLTLKRRHLLQSRVRTLSDNLPEARATTDLDLFLKLEVFHRASSDSGIRAALDRLRFEERTPRWQFENPSSKVVIDLLAREPSPSDAIKVSGIRVGSGSGAGIHGRLVREAYAVEESPITFIVEGLRSDSANAGVSVAVPHPYSWLCMKVRAAADWARWSDGALRPSNEQNPPSPKHAFDACLIVAMLTQNELDESRALAERYKDHEIAAEIRDEATTLFSTTTSTGWIEAQRQANRVFDHELIWPTMSAMLTASK